MDLMHFEDSCGKCNVATVKIKIKKNTVREQKDYTNIQGCTEGTV